MNERKNDKSKIKVSKKLQLTLNFKPEEILDIVCLQIEFQKLQNDPVKVIDYINAEKEQYLSSLKNDENNLNSCLNALYLEVFKIKKFFLKSNLQSYAEQMVKINQASESLTFCRQYINQYSFLLESDIRGRILILFYLLCEIYHGIEISDFSSIYEIEKRYKRNIILFCASFDYTTISKIERKSTLPQLIKFYSSQLIGTMGLIQYELRQYNSSIDNLENSIKTRQENIDDKNILEKYLNNHLKVLEYQLVIYYLKSKKCSCLLKMGRYAECSSYATATYQKIKQMINNVSSEKKQTKGIQELIKQFQNLQVKVVQIIEQSNENARHMLLDNDINDLLKEMKGDDSQPHQESQLEPQENKDNKEFRINSEDQFFNQLPNSEQLSKLSPEKKKGFSNKIQTLANIPYDPELRTYLTSKQDLYQSNQSSQQLQTFNSQKQQNPQKENDLQSYKSLLLKDSQAKRSSEGGEQLMIKKVSSGGIQIKGDQMKNMNNFDSFADFNINQLNPKVQSDQLFIKQIESLNKMNSNKNINSQQIFSAQTFQKDDISQSQKNEQQLDQQSNITNSNRFLKSNSQYTFSAQTFQKEDTKILHSLVSQKGIKSSQLQSGHDNLDKERMDSNIAINAKDDKALDKQKDKKIRSKKLRISPSRVNITNFSYFFKSQDSKNQMSIGQILQVNKEKGKNRNLMMEKQVDQFISGICQPTLQTQQSANFYQQTEMQTDDIQQFQLGTNNYQNNKEQVQQQFDFNTSEKKQESILNAYTFHSQQFDQGQSSDRNQYDSEGNNPNFLFTDTKATETNNPLQDIQKKLTYSTPYIQSTTLNTMTNQDLPQFNTLQTQQRTLNTEQGDHLLQSLTRTETAPNANKQRKKYSKMTIEQFQPYEIKQLIDGSQTERSNIQNGILNTQLSPPALNQFQFKPEYYERAPEFLLTTQQSQSQQDSPVNRKRFFQQQQSLEQSSSSQFKFPLQLSRKDSIPQNQLQFLPFNSQSSPTRNIINQQNKEQLIKQIGYFSQPKVSQNAEYQLIQSDYKNTDQIMSQTHQFQQRMDGSQNLRNSQSQRKQIHFNRQSKSRKSSISPTPSIIISQVDQIQGMNLSRQQSQPQIGSIQDIILNKQQSNEQQKETSSIPIVPKMNLDKVNSEILSQFEESQQNENYPQSHRILSPTTTTQTQISGVFGSQQFGYMSQRTQSPSFSKQMQRNQQQFLQIPSSSNPSAINNISEKYNISQMFAGKKSKKRYSRSTNTSRSNSASIQTSHLRNRFLSSHREIYMNEDHIKMGQSTPKTPNSFAGQFQGSFMNYQTSVPVKSTTVASSTASLNTKTQFDPSPFLLSVNNEIQAMEMLNQRPDFYDGFIQQNNNLSQQNLTRKKKSLSVHSRTRPQTAQVTRMVPSRSVQLHSNVPQEKSLSQNQQNTSSVNYLSSIKVTPIQSVKAENSGVISDPLVNQIQIRKKGGFQLQQRPQSSQPYQTNRIKSISQQNGISSTSNLSAHIANFAQTQPNSGAVKKFYNLNNQSIKGAFTASTRSKSEVNLDSIFMSSNQQQTSALQVVIQEIEFQKKFEEEMKKKEPERNKNLIKNILTKVKDDGQTLLECKENASFIIDENNNLLGSKKVQKNQESSFGIKSLKKIKFSSSVFDQNRTHSHHKLLITRQPSIEKQVQDTTHNEDISNTSNNQDEESQASIGSQSRNTQLNKLKFELQQGNEDIIMDYQVEENPYKQMMSRNSKTELTVKQKKSRFAQPSKKFEDQTPRRMSKVQIINSSSSFINTIQDKKNSNSSNIIISDKEIFRKSSLHGFELEKPAKGQPQGQDKHLYDPNNNNFTIQEEIMSGQLNYVESPEVSRKSNNLFLLLQEDYIEDKQEPQTIKMEDYSVSINIKSQETTRHKRNNTDSLLATPYLQSNKSNSSSQNDQQASQIKNRNSNKESNSPIEISELADQQFQKQWHSQKHKLTIKRNSNNDPNDLRKKIVANQSELNNDGIKTPAPSSTHNQSINSLAVPESCTSSASQFIAKRMNLQLKVPKNLELKRTKMSTPSFSHIEVSSTINKRNGRLNLQFQTSNQNQNLPQQVARRQASQQQKQASIKSITYFNQSVKIQSQTLIKSNLSFQDLDEGREEKKRVVTLFKLLEETNKSYEVRDKFINSISGIIKGIKVLNTVLCYPSITYFMHNNGTLTRVRLSINYHRDPDDEAADEFTNNSIKAEDKTKLNIETISRINSESEQPKNVTTYDKINDTTEIQKEVEVELVIQYEQHQKIYIPINLTRGLLDHPLPEHSLLITVWPLVFKEMQRYMTDNHLIDVSDKRLFGMEEEENWDEIKITLYEDKYQIKQLLAKHSTLQHINESSDSQNLNSDIQLNSGLNKSPTSKPQYMNTLQNIPQIDELEDQDKSKNTLGSNLKNPKKYLTFNQINSKKSEINLYSPFPTTSDSTVNRKLAILRDQYEDLSIGFKLFGGLQQYFARNNSADALAVVQKRKKKILSLLDLFEITELKDKVNSFLRFSFIKTQKEIGRGFCQDFSNESYYRYYLKHLLFLKRQLNRIRAGMIEFPDEDSTQPLLLTETVDHKLNYFYQSQSIRTLSNYNSMRMTHSQSQYQKMKTPQLSQQSINLQVSDRILDVSNNNKRKSLQHKESGTSSEFSIVSEKQNESITIQNKIQQSKQISVANSVVRKTIFVNPNYQKQFILNYFQHLRETQSFVQRVLENYLRSSPSIILSFVKKNQGQYYLIVAKLVIKQEAIFNKLFDDNGEFDIKDNYYFYVTARSLSNNLKSRMLLPPIEIQQEQLKPYFYQGELGKGISSEINRFIIFGQMSKKQQLGLFHFFDNQIGITSFDKSDGTTKKQSKQKINFKDTLSLGQKMQVADWNSNLAQNLELYNIIYRQITQKSLFDGTSTSDEIEMGYYNLFANNFNQVYQEQIKSKRAALSLFHNYDDNDTDEEKMQEQNNKYYEQFKQVTYSLPKVNGNDEQEQNKQEILPEPEQIKNSQNGQLKKKNSSYQEVDQDDLKLAAVRYYPHKIQQFLRRRREWFLKIGFDNKMRVNFSFKWNLEEGKRDFTIYLYDQIRMQKNSIQSLSLKSQNIIIRLIKLEEEKYPFMDNKTCKNFQQLSLQNVIQFEKAGLTGSKPIIKQNKEMHIKNIIISSSKSIKEHLISNSSEIMKYYQTRECQFYLNINIYGKCIGLLRFYIMRRPFFNQEQMYVFLLTIQPLVSKTKQIKFVFSLQDLIMIDTDGEVTDNLKHRFTRTDMTKVIKLITSRIRMTRGLFGAYPILMTEQQSKVYAEFKLENQKAKISEQIQKQKYQSVILQRAKQQSQQILMMNGQSPSNSISAQAQMVRSARPSLFSKINSLFLKDTVQSSSPLTTVGGSDQTTPRRKSIFFEESQKLQNDNEDPGVLSTVLSSKREGTSEDQGSNTSSSSQSSRLDSVIDTLSPAIKGLNEPEKSNNQPSKLLSQRRPTKFNSNPSQNSTLFKRPPHINIGKDSILTFSQKLLDMNITIPSTLNENKIMLPLKQTKYPESIKSEQSQESISPQQTPFQIQKQITPSSIDPIMNFLKTKREVKAEISSGGAKSNQNNLNTNQDAMLKVQNSMKSSNSSQGGAKFRIDPSQMIRRTESIESYKEVQESKRQINMLTVNQPVRNPNRKVSFVDQIDDITETFSKMSGSSASAQQQQISSQQQQQHGILKKVKLSDQADQSASSSPKVHFKAAIEPKNENEQQQVVLQSPLIQQFKASLLKRSDSIDKNEVNENKQQNQGVLTNNNMINERIPNTIQVFSPQSENEDSVSFTTQNNTISNLKKDEENKPIDQVDHQAKQEEILQKLKGHMQKQSEIEKEKSNDSINKKESSNQNTGNISRANKNLNGKSQTQQSDSIFQDLRVFKNMISKHDFSDGKQNLTNANKGFLEAYMQKSRIIGQYVRKMANNEYVLITVKKDFILKCWDIQIYIPKTQRVLLSQISHSELIDCSFEFLNKNIASKLRFFYENKNIKPFDDYLSFLNRVNQYSTNNTAAPERQNSGSDQSITSNPFIKPKSNLLGSIISKLKNVEEVSSPEMLKQVPKLGTISPTDSQQTFKKLISPSNTNSNEPSSNESSQRDRKFSFSKKHLQLIKDRSQTLAKSSSIEEHIDLQEQQKLFLQNDQISQKSSQKSDIKSDQFPLISNKSIITENQSPQEQIKTNFLNVPQRSPTKKISLIKLINVEDDDNKEGEYTNKTNKSLGQKSNISGDAQSNKAAPSDYNGDNTPKSSASSKRSIIKPLSIQNFPDSPSQLLSKMIESSMKKGQRRLTFKMGQQHQLMRQNSQNLLTSKNSFDEQPVSSRSLKKSEALGDRIQSGPLENTVTPHQSENQLLTLLKKKSSLKFENIQEVKDIKSESENLENKQEQSLIKDIEAQSSAEQQNTDTQKLQNQNYQFLQKKTSIPSPGLHSIEESAHEEGKTRRILQKQQSLLFSMSKGRGLQRKDSVTLSNDNLATSKKLTNSVQKGKESAFSRVKRQSLFHSSSLAEDFDDESRRRSKTGIIFEQKDNKQLPQKTMKFSPQLGAIKKQSLFGQQNQQQNGGEAPQVQGGQKRNLKSLISQNQQKIVGERNLNALVDFMKPKQFEKLSLQQKMQAITEEMDVAFMTGCPNDRIERLVRYIEMKIWSNFLSQCEFRTDDKHFKVVLFFGSSRLNIQEQLFHEYVRVDQNNESVIEIDVELQESLLFVHRDTQLSTRVQLLQYFFTSFKSIPYTMTSNFSFTVQNVIINKGNIRKFNVNVRELLNLFIAEGFYRFQTNYMSSKVSYSELKNLAYFLIHKIKSSNFLELMKTQEKNVSLDKARSKNQSSHTNLQSSQIMSPSKSSQNSLHSFNQLSDTKLGSNNYLSASLFNLSGNKKQKQNFIMLKDDNMMYFYEKVINVQLKLIMRVSYFTRGHHFQLAVHKCGTTLSIIRNKNLKYFTKKIPFIQLFMKNIELFDTALSRVCEYMKPKMILYFIIQHNLPLDQRYFSKITNTQQQRKKKFSVFSSTQINFSKQDSESEVVENISDFNLDEDDNNDDDDDDDEEDEDVSSSEEDEDDDDILRRVQESQGLEYSDSNMQQSYNISDAREEQHEYFSSKSLTPLKFNKKNSVLRFHQLNLQKSQYYQNENQNQNSSFSSQNKSDNSSLSDNIHDAQSELSEIDS